MVGVPGQRASDEPIPYDEALARVSELVDEDEGGPIATARFVASAEAIGDPSRVVFGPRDADLAECLGWARSVASRVVVRIYGEDDFEHYSAGEVQPFEEEQLRPWTEREPRDLVARRHPLWRHIDEEQAR